MFTRSYAALQADLDWIVGPGYDEEVKQVAAKTGTDYLVKAWGEKPLLPTHGFQTFVPQVKMESLPLPGMKGTVQDGLPLRTDPL